MHLLVPGIAGHASSSINEVLPGGDMTCCDTTCIHSTLQTQLGPEAVNMNLSVNLSMDRSPLVGRPATGDSSSFLCAVLIANDISALNHV